MNRENLLAMLGRFPSGRILVLGDVMLDRFVYGSVDRISPEAPIPVLSVDRQLDMPGGAANVVRNCASLGARATLVGVVGDDLLAQDLKTQLTLLPTVDAHLIVDSSRPTTLKTRFVADRQQVMRADVEQRTAISDAVAENVLVAYRKALVEADIVVLSDYAKGVLSERVTREAIMSARDAGKAVVVDPKSRDFSKYEGATALTPNRGELELACGELCTTDDQIAFCALRFLEQRICQTMLVTRGPHGMSVVSRDLPVVHLPANAREVFDVSGAGDTAVATFSLGLAAAGSVIDAARLANLAAGLVVAKLGTAVVSAGEIESALRQFDGHTGYDKLFSFDNVVQLTRTWRDQGLTVAFTNGCFDLLHPGHVFLLEQARRTADRLIVGLNSDQSVMRLKGTGRPIQSEVARATILSSLKSVDAVVIFPEDTPLHLIETLLPDVLVKGADYSLDKVVGADVVVHNGGRVVLADLISGQSTTGTLARVTASRVP